MEDKYLIVKEKIEKYGQEQLLNFYNKLDKKKQEKLLQDILSINFEQIQKLYSNIKKENKKDKIEPIKFVNKEKLFLEEQKYYMEIGEKLIRKGEYAVVTMAGGQRNKTWT